MSKNYVLTNKEVKTAIKKLIVNGPFPIETLKRSSVHAKEFMTIQNKMAVNSKKRISTLC